MPFSELNARAMPTATLGAAIILRLPRAAIDSNLGVESAASRERLARGGRSAVLHANEPRRAWLAPCGRIGWRLP
jgi:hypothetical protein